LTHRAAAKARSEAADAQGGGLGPIASVLPGGSHRFYFSGKG